MYTGFSPTAMVFVTAFVLGSITDRVSDSRLATYTFPGFPGSGAYMNSGCDPTVMFLITVFGGLLS